MKEFAPVFLLRAEKDRYDQEVSLISVRNDRTFRMIHFTPLGASKQKACIYAGKNKYTPFFSDKFEDNLTVTLGQGDNLLIISMIGSECVKDQSKFPSFLKEQEITYFISLLRDGNVYEFLIYYLLFIEWIRDAWLYKKEN